MTVFEAWLPVEKRVKWQINTLRRFVREDEARFRPDMIVILGEEVCDAVRLWADQLIALPGYTDSVVCMPWDPLPDYVITAPTALHVVDILFHEVYKIIFDERPKLMRAGLDEESTGKLISRYLLEKADEIAFYADKISRSLNRSEWYSLIDRADREFTALTCPPTTGEPQTVIVTTKLPGHAERSSADLASPNPRPTNDRIPVLRNWAFGYDGTGQWWLFHKRDSVWETPGKVVIPGGLPNQLMQLAAENHGQLERAAATAWLGERQPMMPDARRRDSVKENVSRARAAIKALIASAGKFVESNIGDPMPFKDGAWIVAVEIGFAVKNDQRRLEFKRKEDM